MNKTLNHLPFYLIILFLIFFAFNAPYLSAREFTIDRLYTTDLNNNEKTNFFPGEPVKYNLDITIDSESRVEANGKVTGVKPPKKKGKDKKWDKKLKKQKAHFAPGKRSLSWISSIPNDAKLDSEAVVTIKAKAKPPEDNNSKDDNSKDKRDKRDKRGKKGDDDSKDKDNDDEDDKSADDDRPIRLEASLTFTIGKPNTKPDADAGPHQSVFVGTEVQLNGSNSSDIDGDLLSFTWTMTDKPEASEAILSNTTIVNPTFTVDAPGMYVAQLIVNDGELNSQPGIVKITTINSQPVAHAGPDQTAHATQIVQLDGSASSDVDGDQLTFKWAFTLLPDTSLAVFSDSKAINPTFIVDRHGTYTAALIVNDNQIDSGPDTVSIFTENSPPVANAGDDQTTLLFQIVQLNGAQSSDVDGDLITFKWSIISKPENSLAALSDKTIVNPVFTADLHGLYVIQLIVDDGNVAGQPDTVSISTENSPPKAVAGPDQTAFVTDIVMLDAGASTDPDGDALTYKWSFTSIPEQSQASLSDPLIKTPFFTMDKPGEYVIQLIVNDGTVDSEPDSATISSINSRPLAIAGPDQTIPVGSPALLDGNMSSDADGDQITFAWSFISIPQDSQAGISGATLSNPEFFADLPGMYVAQLIVNDGKLASEPDTVTITTENRPPIAVVSPDQIVTVGDNVQLSAAGSIDPDGSQLGYNWALISMPDNSNAGLTDETAIDTAFTADKVGVYIVRLVVDDGELESDPADAVITAILVVNSQPPVAVAGLDQEVAVGALTQLDGNQSFDPEGDVLNYKWTFSSIPEGSQAAFSDPEVADPTFIADLEGTYVAKLVVNDSLFKSPHDIVNIKAIAPNLNEPPTLNSIGNITVALGSDLTINLAAVDPDNDTLAFAASPLPLPVNSNLNALTGKFTFKPSADQVGNFELTFTVGDGRVSSSETVVITVTAPEPGAPTSFTGRLLDTNDFTEGIETPVVGAVISLLNTGSSAVSDNSGRFALVDVPSGEQILDINCAGANLAPDGSPYSGFRERIVLIDGVENAINRPFFMPRQALESLTTVDPTTTTLVENTKLNMCLEVGPGIAKNEDGTNYTGQLSISEVPEGIAPAQMPDEMQPGLLITIQPVGVTFSSPVPITFPNIDHMLPGSELDIWSLDPETGKFIVVGKGRVSADGSVIETISGGVRAADWHFVAPRSPDVEDVDDKCVSKECDDCNKPVTGSRSSVKSGDYIEEHNLVTYRSLGASKGLRFVYNTKTADPRPIIKSRNLLVPFMPMPLTVSSKLTVAGIEQGLEYRIAVKDTTIQAIQFDASEFKTGIYPYKLQIRNNYFFSSFASNINGKTGINNQKDSPFGAGWELDGLTKIIKNSDRSVSLVEGNGDLKVFGYNPPDSNIFRTIEYTSPPGDFSELTEFNDGTFVQKLKNGTDIHFNSQGQQTTIDDRNHNTTTYAYDADSLLTSITDPVGLVTTLSYTNGKLTSVTDPANRVTTFEHDDSGNLTRIIDPDNSARDFIYDERHRIVMKISKRGFAGTIHYNFAGQNTMVTRADGSTRQIIPSDLTALIDPESGKGTKINPARPIIASENIGTLIDGNGGVTTYKTGISGGSTEIIDQIGRATTITRDENGKATNRILPNGNSLSFIYNSIGDILEATNEGIGSSTVQFTYEPRNNKIAGFTDPNGNTTLFSYDLSGNMTQAIDALGSVFNLTYDNRGLVSTVVYPVGSLTVSLNHDIIGNLTSATDPLGNTGFLEYDQAGNAIKQTDAEGRVTEFMFDAMNRLVQVLDAKGGITGSSYDLEGNLTTITDPRGKQTLFEYDEMNRLITKTNPLGLTENFTYDANENLVGKINQNGEAIEFRYDAANQLIKKILPDDFVTTFEYDAVGNAVAINNPHSQINRTFDFGDRITSVSTSSYPNLSTKTLQYTYDLNGNRLTMVDPLGGVTNYTLDALNRIASITNPSNQTTNFIYDELHRQTSRTYPNGDSTTFVYESLGRLSDIINNSASGSTISSYSYAYNQSGNRVSQTEQQGERNFTYDLLNRLVSTDSTVPALTNETFSYDQLGNRLTMNGTLAVSSGGTDTTKRLIYNAENKLEKFEEVNADGTTRSIATYKYDWLGRRIEKNVDGKVKCYVYDFEDILMEYSDNNILSARYTYGSGVDTPLIMQRDINADLVLDSFFYHSDVLGSITELTDAQGIVVQNYKFDSFGSIVEDIGGIDNPYAYAGRELNNESGLYFYRARYYDTNVGRFMSVDPIGFLAGLNLYTYVQNNPVNFIDPWGFDGALVPETQSLGPSEEPYYPKTPICLVLYCTSDQYLYPSDFSGNEDLINETFNDANETFDLYNTVPVIGDPSSFRTLSSWDKGLQIIKDRLDFKKPKPDKCLK